MSNENRCTQTTALLIAVTFPRGHTAVSLLNKVTQVT